MNIISIIISRLRLQRVWFKNIQLKIISTLIVAEVIDKLLSLQHFHNYTAVV